MSNDGKPEQIGMFDPAEEMKRPGAWDAERRWRREVSESLTGARIRLGKDRFAVAGDIARMIDKPFSEPVLNQYSSESRDNYQFPGNKVAPFCRATLDLALVDLILEPLIRCPETYAMLEALLIRRGFPVVTPEEKRFAELGRQIVQSKQSRSEALKLAKDLMDGK